MCAHMLYRLNPTKEQKRKMIRTVPAVDKSSKAATKLPTTTRRPMPPPKPCPGVSTRRAAATLLENCQRQAHIQVTAMLMKNRGEDCTSLYVSVLTLPSSDVIGASLSEPHTSESAVALDLQRTVSCTCPHKPPGNETVHVPRPSGYKTRASYRVLLLNRFTPRPVLCTLYVLSTLFY